MTLRQLRYDCFCAMPEEVEFRRHQAQRELESLVPEHMHPAVTWQTDVVRDSDGEEYMRITWSLRMDDDELLQPLDD